MTKRGFERVCQFSPNEIVDIMLLNFRININAIKLILMNLKNHGFKSVLYNSYNIETKSIIHIIN